jgi:hypothetical protein
MIQKIVSALMNWILSSILIPISMVIVDYFKMKKTIKQLNIDIEKLKNAKTIQEKIDATNSIP